MKRIGEFLRNNKGSVSDRAINFIIVAILVYSLFSTIYVGYTGTTGLQTTACPPYYNESSPCPSSHFALIGVTIVLFMVGIVLLFWKMAKSGR